MRNQGFYGSTRYTFWSMTRPKFANFWMVSGRICSHLLEMETSHFKLSPILKTLISHGRYCKNEGAGPSRGVQNVFKKHVKKYIIFIWFLGRFWDRFRYPKTIRKSIKKTTWKSIDFLIDFCLNFGRILEAQTGWKTDENYTEIYIDFYIIFNWFWEPLGGPNGGPKGSINDTKKCVFLGSRLGRQKVPKKVEKWSPNW